MGPGFGPGFPHFGQATSAGDFAAAADMIGKAIAIAPATADYHANRGAALRELQQFAAAVEHFDRAIALGADVAEVHYNRAIALLQLGQFAAAIEDFLQRETRGVAIYLDELNERTPFKQTSAPREAQ